MEKCEVQKDRMREYSRNRRQTEKELMNQEVSNYSDIEVVRRVEKFRNMITQGPCYTCVSCHRCHYLKSVVHYKEDNKYSIETDNIFQIVNSFDGKQYTCHTCHKKLLKGSIPCQSVWNKLQVYELPSELTDIRKLEKAIISERYLFKKVAIMPKGQMPKLKGSICNVPIDTNELYNVLPRRSNSTGIIMVKLK